MRIFIFGGTTEGRLLAQKLAGLGADVAVSVATSLGAEELKGIQNIEVFSGRKNDLEMERMLQGANLCIDATHPYAKEVSENIRKACIRANVPLRRLLRRESGADGAICVADCRSAALFLKDKEGNILLTTGTKELSAFDCLDKNRLLARVLPTCESIKACEAFGLAHRNILALYGPFTREMNEAMIKQYGISWLVTKDGGRAGGFEEKMAAARNTGVKLVLVSRPEEAGESMEAILESVGRELL